MKRILSVILATVFLFISIPFSSIAAKQGYDDVTDICWCKKSIIRASEKGLMQGVSKTQFSPDTYMSRAMAVTVLAGVSGADMSQYSYKVFTDVERNCWYERQVAWAYEKGIVSGTGENRFSPDLPVSREQLCVMISKYVSEYGGDFPQYEDYYAFADEESISGWAVTAVIWAQMRGIISHLGEGYCIPQRRVTRGEAAVMLVAMTGDHDAAVIDKRIHARSVTLDRDSIELTVWESDKLTATVTPVNACDASFFYATTDATVARVYNDGVVTAEGVGEAYIYVYTSDGLLWDSCRVTVNNKNKSRSFTPASNGRYIDPNAPMIALTFDDGPNPINTQRILNTLESYGVVATFFDQGYLVELYPAVVQREAAIGCEVANHSYNHPNLSTLTTPDLLWQINHTNQIFINTIGYAPTLVRPPYGSCNSNVRNCVSYPLILWSVDTLDWKTRSAYSTYNSVMNNAGNGSVVLMHGIYKQTADAVEMIVPALIERGYQLVTVSELAYYHGYTLNNGQTYGSFY